MYIFKSVTVECMEIVVLLVLLLPPALLPLLQTLTNTADLKTSACCTSKAPPTEVVAVLRQLPQEIVSRCGGNTTAQLVFCVVVVVVPVCERVVPCH